MSSGISFFLPRIAQCSLLVFYGTARTLQANKQNPEALRLYQYVDRLEKSQFSVKASVMKLFRDACCGYERPVRFLSQSWLHRLRICTASVLRDYVCPTLPEYRTLPHRLHICIDSELWNFLLSTGIRQLKKLDGSFVRHQSARKSHLRVAQTLMPTVIPHI